MFNNLVNYIKGVRVEIKHVNWPTRKQSVNFTFLIVSVTIIVAAFLGVFDILFAYLLKVFVL